MSDDITNDAQILRKGIEEELKAVSLYENLAEKAKSPKVKKLMLDVAKEEKVHIGEFETLLDSIDKEHKTATAEGAKEVGEVVGESTILASIASVICDEKIQS